MSTARTTIGCLAEDYIRELADICRSYVDQIPDGVALPERASRARDVALTFIQEAGAQR